MSIPTKNICDDESLHKTYIIYVFQEQNSVDGDNSTWWQFPPISTANSYIPVHIQVNFQRIFAVNMFTSKFLIAIFNSKVYLNLNKKISVYTKDP